MNGAACYSDAEMFFCCAEVLYFAVLVVVEGTRFLYRERERGRERERETLELRLWPWLVVRYMTLP